MKILVTGGAGFIGSHLVDHLLNNGANIYVIDNLSNGLLDNLNSKCNFIEADVLDIETLEKLPKFEAIYHLAAVGSVPRSVSNPDLTFSANVIGTKNILDIARVNKSRVIFSSSSSVYGENQSVPMLAKTWTSPLSPYAASKASGEALVRGYGNAFEFKTNCFRFFNVYGPRQRPDSVYAAVIPKFFDATFKGYPLEIHGDGEQSRDFTYVADVIDVLAQTLNKDSAPSTPVNLAFGYPTSINKLVQLIQKITKTSINFTYSNARIGDIKNSSADSSDLISAFPEIKQTPIEVGLRWTYESLATKFSD